MGEVVRDWHGLRRRLDLHRAAGETIVSTNGVFDVLHVGHVRYLQQARDLGDLLVIGINSDTSTRLLKGPQRPFVPEGERAEMLAALSCVDYVTVFDEASPEAMLAVIKPDIHAKGGDYVVETMPETPIIVANGGRVVALPFVQGRSTTDLIERILATKTDNNST